MVASGCVCGPSPEPGTHWRATSAQPGFCVGRSEGTAFLLGRRGSPPCGAAIVTAVMMAPQYVFGAATWVGTRRPQSRQDTRPTADCASVHTAEKNSKKPLSGAVCLLTRRGLIRVRCGIARLRPSHAPRLYPFSSFFSAVRKRQSVPWAMICCGVDLIIPTSCRRRA